MSLIEYKNKFTAGLISRKDYIEYIYKSHLRLFEYSQFIKNTGVNSIEIQSEHLFVNLKNGIKLYYPIPDKGSATFDILIFSTYEKNELSMILKLLKYDAVFFDIGANIGWYSVNIARQEKTLSVYAFEPIDAIYKLLNKNIILNNISNVSLHNIGFSNKKQNLDFYFDQNCSAYTSLKNTLEKTNAKRVTAQVIRLDEFFLKEQLTRLDFVKCDVEGAELLVFEGGLETIKKYTPIIFTEMVRKWTRKFDYHPNVIIKLLADLGYYCFFIENEKLVKFSFMDEEMLETNFFFLHKNKHAVEIELGCA